jgi:hypothetical protein
LGILHKARKNIILGVKKVKISLQSPKTEFGAQDQYGRVLYPSFGNFRAQKINGNLKNLNLGISGFSSYTFFKIPEISDFFLLIDNEIT